MSDERRGASPWVFIGVGCLLAVLLIVAAVVALGLWLASSARELAETMEDPAARNELAVEVLATEELPEGYHTMETISLPFLGRTVMLTNLEPDEEGRSQSFGTHGFVYAETSLGYEEEWLDEFFDGGETDSAPLAGLQISLDVHEFIDRGTIDQAGRTLRYVSQRGDISSPGRRVSDDRAIVTTMMFTCPNSERVRLSVWFGVDTSPEAPADETDFTGTVADPDEIDRFTSGFDVCNR